ncbi:hypothetical protein Tco_0583804 [Tanacetum coccineum]
MEISIADQIALDDALVAPADRLKIGKCNLRLSSDVTSKEATLQVVYDVLKLTPFYKAFQVTADAPEIYMQEFWATAYVHNRSVRFKMNNKKHILGLDQFRDILQICPKVGNKKFEDPPLEKEILAFLASLGHSGDIRKITDVNVNKLHQPWRSFAAIINKCLSGKPSYDSLRLSQAQILWGMYNKKNVDYAYLLWEDFIFQIENKNTKKGNAMYYPRFTKLVVNFVMDKDPSIPRRNKVNWHYARDDPMFTTINVISRNEDTQLYGTILPVALTNEDIRNSESYKEYYAIASGTIPPKTKGRSPKKSIEKKSGGKRNAEGNKCYSYSEAGSGADEATGVTLGVPDASAYDSDDDISWKSSDDDQDDDKLDDDEKTQDDEDEDKNDDMRLHRMMKMMIYMTMMRTLKMMMMKHRLNQKMMMIPSLFGSELYTHSRISSSMTKTVTKMMVAGRCCNGAKSDEDTTYVEVQGNEAVEDNNANLEGRDDVMTDVILPQVQATQQIKDTHVTLTLVNPDGLQQSSSVSSGFVSNMLNPNQDTGVDAIFGQQAEATSLTDIPVTTIVESSFFAPINRPPTPNPLIIQLQQPPILTPATTPSSSLQNLPDFASLFGFDNRLKTLEDNFSEFKQTNQYADMHSSFHYGHLSNQGKVKERSLKDTPKKLRKLVNGNNSDLKVLILIGQDGKLLLLSNGSDIQRALQGLVDGMKPTNSLDTYGDTVTIKRPRDGVDDDQEPFARTDQGFKRRRSGKEPESTSAPRETTTTTAEKTTTEVYKATTEKLDWINPEGQQYPHDLRQPLPLVPNSQGRHVIPFHHFINNDLSTYVWKLKNGATSSVQGRVDNLKYEESIEFNVLLMIVHRSVVIKGVWIGDLQLECFESLS